MAPPDSPARAAAPSSDSDAAGAQLTKVCPQCLGRYPFEFRVCPRDATELEDAAEEADALIGATLGEALQIVRCIGEGGMARVYEARHVRLSTKRFAVKVLHAALAQQSMVVARFQREAEAASGISHPNVVDVYDVSRTPDGLPYLVSEFLDGRDFATLLEEQGKIEVHAAVRIVRQVCRALAAAHAHGVIHRDVKPDNVFLVGDPQEPVAKVLDFGISKVESETPGATLTQTGMIMGTPGYMPPEQARGAKTDARADIYGVGAMLYRAVTGQLPFDSEDAGEALSMVLTLDAPRPRSIEPSIPEALELVIQTAMAKEPEGRYASMQEFDDALAAFDLESRLSMLPSAGRPQETGALAHAPTRVTTSTDLARTTGEARRARPSIVALSVFAYVWAVASLFDAFSGLLVMIWGRRAASSGMLVGITLLATSITPAVFWIRYLSASWKNSVRCVSLAKLLRALSIAAVLPYGLLSLAARIFGEPQDPEWSVAATMASLACAGIVYARLNRSGARVP